MNTENHYDGLNAELLCDPLGVRIRFWQDPEGFLEAPEIEEFSLVLSIEGLRLLEKQNSDYLPDS